MLNFEIYRQNGSANNHLSVSPVWSGSHVIPWLVLELKDTDLRVYRTDRVEVRSYDDDETGQFGFLWWELFLCTCRLQLQLLRETIFYEHKRLQRSSILACETLAKGSTLNLPLMEQVRVNCAELIIFCNNHKTRIWSYSLLLWQVGKWTILLKREISWLKFHVIPDIPWFCHCSSTILTGHNQCTCTSHSICSYLRVEEWR